MTQQWHLYLTALLLATTIGQCQRRQITNLPGLTFAPNFKQYSGYLTALDGNQLFYWLVEASDVAADKAPLMLWLNGGPGCSSIGGLLMTNGPFLADGQARLIHHRFAWNKIVNVLYLDSPVGVGLSQPLPDESLLNDNYTIESKLKALRHFYELFPEYVARPFYIAGESYAGVYIPMLTKAILSSSYYPRLINLRSIAIGNGLLVPHNDATMQQEQESYSRTMGISINNTAINKYNCAKPCYVTKETKGSSYPCLNSTGLTTYLNDPAVRAALGVDDSVSDYVICNLTGIFHKYSYRTTNMLPELLQIIAANVTVMLYHGHLDQLIPLRVTERLLDSEPEQLQRDKQLLLQTWSYCNSWPGQPNRQVGGLLRSFANGRLILRSVIGAGHSVATDHPEAAYQILVDLLRLESFPLGIYGVNSSCPNLDYNKSASYSAANNSWPELSALLLALLLTLLANAHKL